MTFSVQKSEEETHTQIFKRTWNGTLLNISSSLCGPYSSRCLEHKNFDESIEIKIFHRYPVDVVTDEINPFNMLQLD